MLAADEHRSTTQQTAPHNNKSGKFQVTHPFHPLFGRQFEEEGRTSRWGEERVWFRSGRRGSRQTIPLRFTSLAAPDPYVHIGGGRSWHRVEDLLRLRQLLGSIWQEKSQ
jgi:hypothetical protein